MTTPTANSQQPTANSQQPTANTPDALNAKTQAFLSGLEADLWRAADKLRAELDAANYKHIVLGLIFLKYISDSFTAQRQRIEDDLKNPASDYHLDPADFPTPAAYNEAIAAELEDRDYYTKDVAFWVPRQARWDEIAAAATLELGAELPWGGKYGGVAKLIDDAFDAIEKGWCPKMYADKRRANKKQQRHGIFELCKFKLPFAVPVAVDRI